MVARQFPLFRYTVKKKNKRRRRLLRCSKSLGTARAQASLRLPAADGPWGVGGRSGYDVRFKGWAPAGLLTGAARVRPAAHLAAARFPYKLDSPLDLLPRPRVRAVAQGLELLPWRPAKLPFNSRRRWVTDISQPDSHYAYTPANFTTLILAKNSAKLCPLSTTTVLAINLSNIGELFERFMLLSPGLRPKHIEVNQTLVSSR
ncbi:unnamed protein product [Pieris brassicae]|uniref:Uncharacterized protein n=1 Tax=Pieris brassicae TaxID=7116 RepID=A0A9P0T572_PIEBR|nr:unnamed protein product [Pieris brassicae]